MLVERVKGWRFEYARQKSVEGLSWLLSGGLLALTTLLWLDYAFSLPRPVRWLGWVLALGGLGAAAFVLLARPWLRWRWGPLLDAVAREFPELGDHLKPAWELSQAPADPYTSPILKAAQRERTERLLIDLPERPVFPWRPTLAACGALLAAVAAAATLPALGPSPTWERVLRPWRDLPLEQVVRISPGNAVVDWGLSAVISAQWPAWAGEDIREVRLWLKGAGGWRLARWDQAAGDTARFSAEELTEPLVYRLSWRDLGSRVYRITPIPVPRLEGLRATVHGAQPKVLALSPAEALSVLRGNWVTVTGRPNGPLAKASLRLAPRAGGLSTEAGLASWNVGAALSALKPLPTGEFEAGFLVQEDAFFRFELESTDGRSDPEPAVYGLKALPDEPPRVELLSPLAPVQASPADSIPIAYSAKDEGGLSRIALLVRAQGRELEIALNRFTGRSEFLGDYSWSLEGLPLGKTEFQVKAYDTASVPQAGLSATGSVEVVDFQAVHERVEGLWLKAEERLSALAARHEDLKALSRAGSAEWEKEWPRFEEAWREAVAGLSRLAEAMPQDAYANPGLSESAKASAEAMQESLKTDLPRALEASRAGDWGQAQRRHGRLSAQVKQAQRLLREGRKVQGLQDFYTQAGRMSQTGAALESLLESAARGRAPSVEDLSRAQAALSRLHKQLEALQKAIESLPKARPQSAEERSRRRYSLPVGSAAEAASELQRALARGDFAAAAELARRLSEDLARIESAIAQAAAEAAGEGLSREASERLEKAKALWSEAIEEQTRVIEKTQRLDQERLSRKLAAQKELLARLAGEQSVLVSSAGPVPGFPADALASMKAVLFEFQARQVSRAPGLLKDISGRLRGEALKSPLEAAALEWFAAAEDSIGERLARGAAPPPPAADAQSASCQGGQASARARTASLQSELEALEAEVGSLPPGTLPKVQAAQAEQAGAEAALGRGDSSRALEHEGNALSLLMQGQKELAQSAERQRAVALGISQPFSRPASSVRSLSGGGALGAHMGFVPLPSVKDYRPPREIREELERSLQEKRPAEYDGMIKEYFKRIAQ